MHVLVQQKLMPTQEAGTIIAVRPDQWNADEDLTESTFLGDQLVESWRLDYGTRRHSFDDPCFFFEFETNNYARFPCSPGTVSNHDYIRQFPTMHGLSYEKSLAGPSNKTLNYQAHSW